MLRKVSVVLACLFLLSLLPYRPVTALPTMAADKKDEFAAKIDPALRAEVESLRPEETLTFIITLKEQAVLTALPASGRAEKLSAVKERLQEQAEKSQARILRYLKEYEARVQVVPLWIINGLAVTGPSVLIKDVAAFPEVDSILPNRIISAPQPLNGSIQPGLNLSTIHADDLWMLGYTGQGIVIASMDTGVSMSHADLAASWRGGDNSWYDPHGEHPDTPVDPNGHGTQVMGVMVAGIHDETVIGVAPGAQWIAVKLFDDHNQSSSLAVHLSFQWLLDPDNDPETPDAPHVINNSWTFTVIGCNLEFQIDLQALRAAGILPVFAAGNFGPTTDTAPSPSNYPEAFAVGAIDETGLAADFSSRGPSSCGETETVFPELVAPGINIHTTDRGGLFSDQDGTSVAAPHVSGGLALLLQAYPQLSVKHQVQALLASTVDLGETGPDQTYGFGQLDLLSAFNWLVENIGSPPHPPTPIPQTPKPTPTPLPTSPPPPVQIWTYLPFVSTKAGVQDSFTIHLPVLLK